MDDRKTREATKAAEPSESSDDMEMTKLGEDIGEPRTSQPADSTEPAGDKEQTEPVRPTEQEDCESFILR